MALNDNARGALLMIASMAAFTVNDTFMKLLAGSIPLFQLLFLRGLIATTLTAGRTAESPVPKPHRRADRRRC